MRLKNILIATTIAVTAAACGADTPTRPTGPTGPTGPTLTNLTLAVTGLLAVNGSAQVRAAALYSDGSSTDVTNAAAWVSESTDLATVAAGGLVTGRATGQVTIRATYQGVSGTLRITVRGRLVDIKVEALTFTAGGSCAGALEGPGEFSWQVGASVVLSATETPFLEVVSAPAGGYPTGDVTLNSGSTIRLDQSRTYRVRNEAGSLVEVVFRATEWDRSLLPPFEAFADPQMSDRQGSNRYVWTPANGWGNAFGVHTITLGSSGCQVQLTYLIEISTVD